MRGFRKIMADLERHRHLFDLDRDGLGADLCKAATDGVQYAIAREEAPDGARWPDLSGPYEERKRFTHPGNPMAVMEGTMADPKEVAGEVEVTRDRATVTYGRTERARQEAAWFQEGDGNQPPRPFWGFTSESLAEVRKILDERFREA
jgi:hypothetical protein